MDDSASKWVHKPISNVVVQGVTFVGSTEYNVWARNEDGGSLTLVDCIFKDNENVAPVFATLPDTIFNRRLAIDRDWQVDVYNSVKPTLTLNVQKCLFIVSFPSAAPFRSRPVPSFLSSF